MKTRKSMNQHMSIGASRQAELCLVATDVDDVPDFGQKVRVSLSEAYVVLQNLGAEHVYKARQPATALLQMSSTSSRVPAPVVFHWYVTREAAYILKSVQHVSALLGPDKK